MAVRSLLGHVDKDVHVSVHGVAGLLGVHLKVVEEYGVWVESGELIQSLLAPMGYEAGMQKLVFLPFTQIRFILAAGEITTDAHKEFGRRKIGASANGH